MEYEKGHEPNLFSRLCLIWSQATMSLLIKIPICSMSLWQYSFGCPSEIDISLIKISFNKSFMESPVRFMWFDFLSYSNPKGVWYSIGSTRIYLRKSKSIHFSKDSQITRVSILFKMTAKMLLGLGSNTRMACATSSYGKMDVKIGQASTRPLNWRTVLTWCTLVLMLLLFFFQLLRCLTDGKW